MIDLWLEHAMFGALYLVATESGIGTVAWPTDEMAQAKARQHRGLYFVDTRADSTTTRLFLPNYFDSFREWLVGNMSYVSVCLGMTRVLDLLGRRDEALAHRLEAEAFENASAFEPEDLARDGH